MGARDGAKEILMLRPDSSVPSRLLKAILAKCAIEIILVCAVASFAAFSTFSPRLRGDIDVANQRRVYGWVLAPEAPDVVIEVQLFVGEKLVASQLADEQRNDLLRHGLASNPYHGFYFDLNRLNLAPGRHTVQAYAVRQAPGSNKILSPIAKRSIVIEIRR
jgi:hypothetical protein